METTTLGIGSRVEHPHFGKGVVVDVSSETYTIWFKSQNAAKSINKDYELKIIHATEASAEGQASGITLSDIEQALDNILERRLHEMPLRASAGCSPVRAACWCRASARRPPRW